MKRNVLIVLLPLLHALNWLSGFFPRRKNLWVFGSYSNSFTDNSKYLYIHILENHPDIEPVWISANANVIGSIRAAGGKAYRRWSVAGIFHTLRAKHWFVSAYVSDINYFTSRGASLLNLWHGIPLKKIEFDIESGPLAKRFHRPTFLERYLFCTGLFRKPDWLLSTSQFVTDASFASAFRIPSDRCLSLGYPRLDSFFWTPEQRLQWVRRWGTDSQVKLINTMTRHKKTYLYMPTWRDANPNFIVETGIDFEALDEMLKRQDALLILKLHVATPTKSLDAIRGLDNIHIMDSKDDIYPVLPQSTVLITDYSSIYLDYLLLNRPICFFVFDIARYHTESRGFYHKYDEFTPGQKLTSAEQLMQFIESDESDNYVAERTHLRQCLFDHHDGKSSRRIVEFVRTLC